MGLPLIIRPLFYPGCNRWRRGLKYGRMGKAVPVGEWSSPVGAMLLERSIIGWKEYELEVMRDTSPTTWSSSVPSRTSTRWAIHTGDSITVAPAQTLTDKEYQMLRDASLKIIREIGGVTGGSNVQFAVDPRDGRLTVIEMNPRVFRCSALASKATGFPIAKIAANSRLVIPLMKSGTILPGNSPVLNRPLTTWSPRSPGLPLKSFQRRMRH